MHLPTRLRPARRTAAWICCRRRIALRLIRHLADRGLPTRATTAPQPKQEDAARGQHAHAREKWRFTVAASPGDVRHRRGQGVRDRDRCHLRHHTSPAAARSGRRDDIAGNASLAYADGACMRTLERRESVQVRTPRAAIRCGARSGPTSSRACDGTSSPILAGDKVLVGHAAAWPRSWATTTKPWRAAESKRSARRTAPTSDVLHRSRAGRERRHGVVQRGRRPGGRRGVRGHRQQLHHDGRRLRLRSTPSTSTRACASGTRRCERAMCGRCRSSMARDPPDFGEPDTSPPIQRQSRSSSSNG